jgi:hypothetical protein
VHYQQRNTTMPRAYKARPCNLPGSSQLQRTDQPFQALAQNVHRCVDTVSLPRTKHAPSIIRRSEKCYEAITVVGGPTA